MSRGFGWVEQYAAMLLAIDACPHCRENVPHHTVGEAGIGDPKRRIVRDLHEIEDASGVGLAECLAYDAVWKKLE